MDSYPLIQEGNWLTIPEEIAAQIPQKCNLLLRQDVEITIYSIDDYEIICEKVNSLARGLLYEDLDHFISRAIPSEIVAGRIRLPSSFDSFLEGQDSFYLMKKKTRHYYIVNNRYFVSSWYASEKLKDQRYEDEFHI